ncbi:MAG: glycoside hydrolase family 20 protein [Paludibacteraceae bacterium]
MKHLLKPFVLIAFFFLISSQSASPQFNIIPQPNFIKAGTGKYQLSQLAEIQFNNVQNKSKRQFTDYLAEAGFSIGTKQTATSKIRLEIDKNVQSFSSKEAYTLLVNSKEIIISANSETGLFYGIQTLLQLITSENNIPSVNISDYPRFSYRGMHLDVSRHFYSVDFIKKHLNMMARLKINKFHWHLTDGPGWRLEIKKYPLLTQVAAWRTYEKWKDWWAMSPRKYVDIRNGQKAYGGFYTQKEARDIVKYAAERHITIIPEIEMPGHSEEVLAVYPQLSCVGEPYKQSEFCIGNEQTFTFLQNVLKEVMAIFPSKYIHIGGDEADKSHWKKCPKCQARMKNEGLKNEDELQSYLVRRIERFLNKHNRKLLGWDEILEGGLAPEATIMSWRGESGGIKAAKSGHDAIMTPGEFMYLDSYQANPGTQPEAIGGFLPLEKVYSYNPVPKTLTEQEVRHFLGVQSNLWTEYIPTEAQVEYMLYPRVLALSEVAWTNPENKNWEDFKRRVNLRIPYLRKEGINTFTLSDEVAFAHQVDTLKKAILVTLSTEKYGMNIRYTINGTTPNSTSALYKTPIVVLDSAKITAQLFEGNTPIGRPVNNRFDYHLGLGKKVIYNIPINQYYPAAGEKTLIDGEMGGLSHGDGRWQGFMTKGMDVTVDLEKITSVKLVTARFMQNNGPWIYFPKEVIISVSDDNKNFKDLVRVKTPYSKKAAGTIFYNFGWNGKAKGRYIRYQALPNSIKDGWIFVDEIVIW